MNETIAVRRTGSEGWRTAMWVAGAVLGSQMLAGLLFGIFIGAGEVATFAFAFTEQVGVPFFTVLLVFAVVTFAAAVHLAVRVIGNSTVVPWAIWPAMAVLPTAWIFVVLADGSGVLEPILAIMQIVGIAAAFVTLGERRWTKG